MSDDFTEIFKTLSSGIKSKKRSNQRITTECLAVLTEKIRPVMVQACDTIKIGNVGCYPEEDEPYIKRHLDSQDELRFICRGSVVEIRTTINGREFNDKVAVTDVSRELVAKQIEMFIRWSFDLPPSEDR